MADFDAFAAEALAMQDVALGEGDLDVLRFVAGAFGPVVAALDGVDLRTLDPEPVPDFARAPAS
jgi:hypothetical protein